MTSFSAPPGEGVFVTLRVSPHFATAITNAAQDELISRSAWIRRACLAAIERRAAPASNATTIEARAA